MTRTDWALVVLFTLVGAIHGFLEACWNLAVDQTES